MKKRSQIFLRILKKSIFMSESKIFRKTIQSFHGEQTTKFDNENYREPFHVKFSHTHSFIRDPQNLNMVIAYTLYTQILITNINILFVSNFDQQHNEPSQRT